MTNFQHESLAAGRWYTLTLAEQMGNIGSEVSRAIRARSDKHRFEKTVLRASELLDLTMSDARWKGRLKELNRARRLFLDATLGINEFGISLEELDRYFLQFALAARSNR